MTPDAKLMDDVWRQPKGPVAGSCYISEATVDVTAGAAIEKTKTGSIDDE